MTTVVMTADCVGGVWSYALGLCRALSDIRFVLVTLGASPRQDQEIAARALPNVLLIESGFRLEWVAGGQDDVAGSRQWLDAICRRHAADLVHVNGFAQARLGGGLPVVAVAHSDVVSWWLAVHRSPPPAEWDAYRQRVGEGLAAATRVIAPTHAVLDDVERNYGLQRRDGRVIPNGIDIEAFAPLPKKPVIMAAGRIWDAAKNLQLLDGIARDLPWPVEIAGDTAHPQYGAAPLRHARALGILSSAGMQQTLGEAAIFAAPAHYEPFGLAVLEAAAAGCALVLADIPSLRENWEGSALFVPPADGPAWRAALVWLIDDHAHRERLGSLARMRARDFSLQASAARYRALYRELTEPMHRQVA